MSNTLGVNDDDFLDAFEAATVDFHTGNHASAEVVYRKALGKLDDNSAEISTCLRNLGEICAARGDFPEAIRLNLRLLSLDNGHGAHIEAAETMIRLASMYEIAGKLEESEYMFNRAQLLQNRLVWDELGVGQNSPAKQADEQILQDSPDWLLKAVDEANKRYGKSDNDGSPDGPIFQRTQTSDRQVMFSPNGELNNHSQPMFNRTRSETLDSFGADGAGQQPFQRTRSEALPPGAQLPDQPAGPDFQWIPRQEEVSSDGPQTRASRPSEPEPEAGPTFHRQELDPTQHRRPSPSSDIPPKRVDRRRLMTDADLAAPADPLAAPGTRGKINRAYSWWKTTANQLIEAVRIQNQLVASMIGSVAIIIISMSMLFLIAPKKGATVVTHFQDRYHSADGLKRFLLIDDKECEFGAGPKTLRMTYKIYDGKFADTLAIAFGALNQRQYWMTRVGNALKDLDGTELYKDSAPELRLVEYVQTVNNQAALAFSQEHHYPSQFSEESQNVMAYKNPFTETREIPQLDTLTLGSSDTPDSKADYERHHLYLQLQYGQGWKGKRIFAPGSINCCSVAVMSTRGTINLFIALPADRSGHPLSGSLPGSSFYTAFEDGEVIDQEIPDLPFKGQGSLRPTQVWLLEPSMNTNDLDFLKHGAAYFYGLLTFLFMFMYAVIRPREVVKLLLLCIIGFNLGAAIAYYSASGLP